MHTIFYKISSFIGESIVSEGGTFEEKYYLSKLAPNIQMQYEYPTSAFLHRTV